MSDINYAFFRREASGVKYQSRARHWSQYDHRYLNIYFDGKLLQLCLQIRCIVFDIGNIFCFFAKRSMLSSSKLPLFQFHLLCTNDHELYNNAFAGNCNLEKIWKFLLKLCHQTQEFICKKAFIIALHYHWTFTRQTENKLRANRGEEIP